MLQSALLLISLACMFLGMAIGFRVRKHRTEFGRSIRWYEVKPWFNPATTVAALTPHGLKLQRIGIMLIVIGALISSAVLAITGIL